MKSILDPILNLFRFHKMKFVAVILLTAVFGLLIFPFDDLGDLISAKISESTNGAWYVQFDELNLAFFPPGVSTERVIVESNTLPALNADTLDIKPWILGALTAKTGVALEAAGVFNGQVAVDYREGEKLPAGHRLQDIVLNAADINLQQLFDYLRTGNLANLAMQGSLGLQSTLKIDPSMGRQPVGDLTLQASGLSLPNPSFNVPNLGPVLLPTLRLGKLNLQGKMNDGKLNIEDLAFGGPNEDLSGKIKGELGLKLNRDPSGVRPQFGAYNLRVDLTVKKDFIEANSKGPMGLVFAYINGFRQDSGQNARFNFTVSGPNFLAPAQLQKAQ